MIIPPEIMSSYVARCAANVSSDTMRAIIAVESSGNPLAIGDNTTGHAYAPANLNQAKSLAHLLLQHHHSLDLGLAQINSGNYANLHLTADALFNPCVNLQAASAILSNDYRTALRTIHDPTTSLWSALSMYNTGSLYAGSRYVAAIIAKANTLPTVPTIRLLTPRTAAPQQHVLKPSTHSTHLVHPAWDSPIGIFRYGARQSLMPTSSVVVERL